MALWQMVCTSIAQAHGAAWHPLADRHPILHVLKGIFKIQQDVKIEIKYLGFCLEIYLVPFSSGRLQVSPVCRCHPTEAMGIVPLLPKPSMKELTVALQPGSGDAACL